MISTPSARFAAFILTFATSGLTAQPTGPATAPPSPLPPSPAEMWERVRKDLPPFSFEVLKDQTVPADADPRRRLRRMEVRFSSQVIDGKSMDHTAVLFIPAEPALLEDPRRRGKVVIVGQRWNDAFMLFDYGDAIAARTGYPTMILPNPGEFEGRDGEGRWMTFLRTLTQTTRDPANHNYFRLAVPYLRGIQVFQEVLGEKDVRAIIGGHSKRATSAYTAAAIDPEHVAGVVYMGNESTFSATASETFRPVSPFYTQKYVKCPVLYLGATNEDGYRMFNINRIVAVMERPWVIEYIPNYRHASASEHQFIDWQMWVAHVFDGRPLTEISDLGHEVTPAGTLFRARLRCPNKLVHVKFWYVYCDDVPFWRDLVWYPTYAPVDKGDGQYEAFVDGLTPDAWFVEVKDTAMGFAGYVSSLPQDITGKPTQERVSHGWKSRLWRPKDAPGPATRPAATAPASAAEYFPGEHWDKPAAPEQFGWSSEKLAAARQYAESAGTAAVFIVHHGRLVHEWGPTDRRYNVHSIRKSFLSALIGRHVRAGTIRPADSMAALGIDDHEPRLTEVEKRATVGDLLRSRSGVYHVAAYETPAMKAARPPRGSHAPGTFWYYNNWDFNVLGTLFRRATGKTVGQEFQERIAGPLQMEDFRLEDATEHLEDVSIHPAYPFRMTARDMARFGLMFLRQGRWGERQVVAADWVAESTRAYSTVRDGAGNVLGGYGYMWWVELQGRHLPGVDLPEGSFSARGAGGHHILIVPAYDLVIVHRVDTDGPVHPSVTREQFGQIVKLILEAMPAENSPRAAPGAVDFSPRGPVVFDGPCASASAARPWLPDRLDVLVPELMARHKVPGVSIVGIEDRRISWERQYGARSAEGGAPVDAQTVFEAASMTKLPFTCVVLKLVEEGKLDLDRPLADYLDQPYMPYEPRHRLITARMVLAHHSGMPNWRKGGWRAGGPIELIADPGTTYTYSGEGYLFLQRVVEHVTGAPFERLMKERLFDPLGLTLSSHVWEERYEKLAAAGHDENGQVKPDRRLYTEGNAAYSLYCTPAEYAAFIVDLLRPDRSAPHALSAGSLAAMFRRTFRVAGGKPILRCGVRHADYSDRGLGWVIDETASGDRMHHSGSNGTGFRCYCEFDPVKGNGLVIMTNAVGGQALWRDLLAAAGDP